MPRQPSGSDENGNWSSFQLANSAPPLSVTDSAIAPSARMPPAMRAARGTVDLRKAVLFILPWRKRDRAEHHLVDQNQHSSVSVDEFPAAFVRFVVGTRRSLKNCISHIDASHSRQPLVKGERLVRYEVNAVILRTAELPAASQRAMTTVCFTVGRAQTLHLRYLGLFARQRQDISSPMQ